MERYIKTTALEKITQLTKRIRFVSGGTSSSKTMSILMWLIDYCQTHPNKVVSVVSESRPHLSKGASRDFLNIMQAHHYFEDNRWNKTDLTYEFENNTKLEFFSADQPGKVRGPRRDVLFLNEGNNVPYEIFTQLEIRTKDIIWIDSNPTHEYWIYTEVLPKRDIDFLTLTYKDNQGLSQNIIDALESRKDNKNWYKVYVLGELGEAEGRIYKDWEIIKEIPHEAALRRYGLDFGYTNDPTAIVAIYYYNGGFILDEIAYNFGMTNKAIYDLMINQQPALVVADSSEPKSIDEIKKLGLNIVPAQKGQGSVLQGIQNVQAQRISVTSRSINILKEYRNYLWITDKDGKIVNEPQEFLNHCMDAIRYGMDSFRPLQPIPQTNEVGGILPYLPGVG